MMRFALLFSLLLTYIYAAEIKIDENTITKAHNDLRKQYGSPALKYSKRLEKASKKWATKLQGDGCGMLHSHGKVGPTGENLFWASASKSANTKDANGNWIWHSKRKKVNEQEVVQAWYDEVQWYDYETNSCEKGQMCGHYTQVIWNTTTELGCAAMACDDRSQVWVCEYAPAGNVTLHHQSGKVERLKPY
ncbi:MAG: CAP domain-containing protein [Sulfurimonadaceae bacterium]